MKNFRRVLTTALFTASFVNFCTSTAVGATAAATATPSTGSTSTTPTLSPWERRIPTFLANNFFHMPTYLLGSCNNGQAVKAGNEIAQLFQNTTLTAKMLNDQARKILKTFLQSANTSIAKWNQFYGIPMAAVNDLNAAMTIISSARPAAATKIAEQIDALTNKINTNFKMFTDNLKANNNPNQAVEYLYLTILQIADQVTHAQMEAAKIQQKQTAAQPVAAAGGAAGAPATQVVAVAQPVAVPTH